MKNKEKTRMNVFSSDRRNLRIVFLFKGNTRLLKNLERLYIIPKVFFNN